MSLPKAAFGMAERDWPGKIDREGEERRSTQIRRGGYPRHWGQRSMWSRRVGWGSGVGWGRGEANPVYVCLFVLLIHLQPAVAGSEGGMGGEK